MPTGDDECNSKSSQTDESSEISEMIKSVAPDGEQENDVTNAVMQVQKFYRGYRTRRLLADSAVVAEELWWQAIDFARLNHSTVSFFNYTKETASSRWNRITLNASKVGKGLSKDSKAQKLAFQHWIEAIDPRHRYGHSLHLYYEEWCKADAGQPFFFWLDIGDGKEVDLGKCPRSTLRQQCIRYLGPQEREHYEYIVEEGKIVHKQSGEFLDTTKGKWIFVMSTSKRLYSGVKQKGVFHHSSFLAGGATLAAGRLVVEDGTLTAISAYSGHYRPTDDRLQSFLSILRENGLNLDNVKIHKADDDCDKNGDKKSSKGDLSSMDSGISLEQVQVVQTEEKTTYKRTLSGGLQNPKSEIPAKAILERINSRKEKKEKSYQLGHQLSLKWSTGVGPRIGCIADYPMELRFQALEFTNLSPKTHSPSFLTYRRAGDLASPKVSPKSAVDIV
jgi:hypothetical protein